jgi:hypothetical protein
MFPWISENHKKSKMWPRNNKKAYIDATGIIRFEGGACYAVGLHETLKLAF